MRLAHKRKVQAKLQKRIQATLNVAKADPVAKKPTAKKAVEAKVEKPAVKAQAAVSLTPKQQSVLDIVAKNPEGINPKGIGLEAGQEDAKAASWATGALKKLLEDSLVVKEQLAGNKVVYKPV
ncbi:MarR family transcriptional regulator [Vibrio sp. S9_S30]|uniref:MarR family transcriptional regulator n=1 Tax=Vibrio sp. S9_S30 TaxID=2720226 RepID=UPI001680BBBB|nr:MarR family transcriptional regulator [Vibrio sp. S9_S30]MBD1558333.1 MarR family transcriptional regulator [Vibrio sp. S9_S30]